MTEQLVTIANNIFDVLAVLTVVSPLVISAIKWLQAKTTDKRIQVLESYTLRVVTAVEQMSNLLPSDKKAVARTKMLAYINNSKLKLKVTEDQLDDLIEAAVNKLSDSATAGTKKESTVIYDAEKVAQLETVEDAKLVEVVEKPEDGKDPENLITTVTD